LLKRLVHSLLLCACAATPALAQTAAPAAADAPTKFDLSRPEIAAFIDNVVAQDGLDRKSVVHILSKGEPRATILDRSSKPAERVLEWWEYRDRFVNAKRIDDGVHFYLDHRQALETVAKERGVAAEYIVAILGAETNYGTFTGKDRVLDALMTLAFDDAARPDFFRSELEQFLLLAREEKIDPLTVTGSYSGAMGAPQFMPSTYRRFAVDGNSDKRRNLWTDWDDVFASVANYFQSLGWQPGARVIADAQLDPDPSFQIDPRNLELNETLDSLNAKGVRIGGASAPTAAAIAQSTAPAGAPSGATQVVLISAEQKDGPAYRVGFKNFYVITRYNHSARYAMAVNDLADAIAVRVHSVRSADTGIR
jgi:membrane-bound lytic murein transglycosylase B